MGTRRWCVKMYKMWHSIWMDSTKSIFHSIRFAGFFLSLYHHFSTVVVSVKDSFVITVVIVGDQVQHRGKISCDRLVHWDMFILVLNIVYAISAMKNMLKNLSCPIIQCWMILRKKMNQQLMLISSSKYDLNDWTHPQILLHYLQNIKSRELYVNTLLLCTQLYFYILSCYKCMSINDIWVVFYVHT